MKLNIVALLLLSFVLAGCKKNTSEEPSLIFRYKFDKLQPRLDNFGNAATLPANHAGQSPDFKSMSAHYIELAPGPLTQLGEGAVLYRASETSVGGSLAIDFEKAANATDGEVFFKIPLKDIKAGEYEWLRVSLAYQNYEVKFLIDTNFVINGTNYPVKQEFPCNVASFVGFNSYIKSYKLNTETVAVNGNRLQGYWGSEAYGSIYGQAFKQVNSGQAPAGATTVVNPLSASSPIPAGSCVVTGKFSNGNLKITGNETKDIEVEVALSINNSFEWNEVVNDGKWEPAKGENVVDMGVRGMIPRVK
jgi:hypothetical protein